MSTKLAIPPDTEPVPVTAQELARHMERLLSQVAPRVVCEASPLAEKTSYTSIEAAALIEELSCWTSDN